MSTNDLLFEPDSLEKYISKMYERAGMPEEDARWSAHCQVLTNLWGIDSHGVLRTPAYIERVKKKAVNPTPDIKVVKENGGMTLLHGDDGMGYVVGKAAMEKAIEKAKDHNIASVGVIRSNHFGAAAIYARQAAEAGYIGIVATNVIPNIGVVGSQKPSVGNNPIAFSVPTYGEFPFVLDISLSAVSGGKLLLKSKRKEKIPTNWAVDPQGNPTDDPDEGFKGFLLPTGGHKGFGLALFVDIICGVINGGVFLQDMQSMYKHPDDPSLTCHQMIVMNPQAFLSRNEMKQRMDSFIDMLKQTPMQEGYEMLLPGELEHRSAEQRKREGIPLSQALYDDLIKLAGELGIDETLTPKR